MALARSMIVRAVCCMPANVALYAPGFSASHPTMYPMLRALLSSPNDWGNDLRRALRHHSLNLLGTARLIPARTQAAQSMRAAQAQCEPHGFYTKNQVMRV